MYESALNLDDVFMKDFKFYKQFKSVDELKSTGCIFLDNLNNHDLFNVLL